MESAKRFPERRCSYSCRLNPTAGEWAARKQAQISNVGGVEVKAGATMSGS